MDDNSHHWLIPGERELCRDEIVDGTIYQTNYRFLVTSNKQGRTSIINLNIPIYLIFRVDLVNMSSLKVYSKLGGVETVNFKSEMPASTWLKRFTKHLTINSPVDDSFAYVFKRSLQSNDELHHILLRGKDVVLNTINVDIIHKEYSRLNFNHSWKISNVNKDFKICHSYPKSHIVPKSVDDKSIKLMSNFRGHNRFPSVVWRSKYTGAVLLRCSQPCIGLSCSRNEYDEQFIASVIKSVIDDRKNGQIINKDTEFKSGLIIIDARSYSAAQLNRLRGGGLEHTEYYQNCQIEFKDLPNLHNVRQYFEKLINLIGFTQNMNWFSYLETTNWLTYIGQLLKTAWEIAKNIHIYGQPVMVHCTDGWDRTSQLVSLAEILLDPYYRSIRGFQVLVEREWLMFGHKFGDRCGNGTGTLTVEERSPIFLQWLDCVYQLIRQFPQEFEFNETFLIKLAIHTYSGLFGTFLFNSERDRMVNKVVEKTCCLWSMLTWEYEENWTIFNHLYTLKKNELSSENDVDSELDGNKVFILKPRWENRYLHIWLSLYQKGFPTHQDLSKSMNALDFVCSEAYTDSEEDKRDDRKELINVDVDKCSSSVEDIDYNNIQSSPNQINVSDGLFIQDTFFTNGRDDSALRNSVEFDQFDTQITTSCSQDFPDSLTKRHKTVSTSSSEVGLYIVGNMNGDGHLQGQDHSEKNNNIGSHLSMAISDDFPLEDSKFERSLDNFEDEEIIDCLERHQSLVCPSDSARLQELFSLPPLSHVDGMLIHPDSATMILRRQHLERNFVVDNLNQIKNSQANRISSLMGENELLRQEIEALRKNLEKRTHLSDELTDAAQPLSRTPSSRQQSFENNHPDHPNNRSSNQSRANSDTPNPPINGLHHPAERIKNPSSESFDLISDLECNPVAPSDILSKSLLTENTIIPTNAYPRNGSLYNSGSVENLIVEDTSKVSHEPGYLLKESNEYEKTPTSSSAGFSYVSNQKDSTQTPFYTNNRPVDDLKQSNSASSSSQCNLDNVVSA